MEVICDNCKIKVTINELKTQQLENGIERIYIICPNCGTEFTTCLTIPQSRKIADKIKRLVEDIKSRREKGYDVTCQCKQVISLQKKHKKILDELNNRAPKI